METNVNRRRLLAGLAAAPATVVAAPLPAVAAPVLSPKQRLDAAAAELLAAASEAWPDFNHTVCHIGEPGDIHEGLPVLITMHRKAEPKYEKWSGPGRYEVQHGKARPIYYVERTATGDF